MRILHVTDNYGPQVGGIEVFVEDLANRQIEAGHDVSVLTAAAPGPARASAPNGPVQVFRAPSTLRHPLASPWALETALTGPYDVVHGHMSVFSRFTATVGRATDEAGIPTVNTVHSMWASRRQIVRIVRAVVDWDRSTAAWTTVSHAAAADMLDVLHAGTEIHVVPNAVDVDWWRAEAPRRGAGGQVTVVSVMRLAGRKRPMQLLDILGRVRANLPPDVGLRAVIVGDGPLRGRLGAQVAARGLGDCVTFTGALSREEIRTLYRTADVYVAPAYQESFGIAALEARAAGLPVVAMSSGGVGEFIEHGVEGVLCVDDDAMATALTSLASNQALRSAITEHNAAHRPVHDWPNALAGFDEVYRQVHARNLARRQGAAVAG